MALDAENPKKLVNSHEFQTLLKNLIKSKKENPWWQRWEPDHATETALENLIKAKCPELYGTLLLEDLNSFTSDALLQASPQFIQPPAPTLGKFSLVVDFEDLARKVSELLLGRYGSASFRFPLFSESCGEIDVLHDFGGLGAIIAHKEETPKTNATVSGASRSKSFSAQTVASGFLFEGASALTSIASEKVCSLLVFLWLTYFVNFVKGRPLSSRREWRPFALLGGDPLESAVDLSSTQNSLVDAERLCSWSLVNDTSISITIGLAKPKQHWASPINDAKALSVSFGKLSEVDAERFKVAFHFFASSIAASTSAHAILNLCIALECALGWELAREKGERWSPHDNRGRIEARLEMCVGGDMSNRVKAKRFIKKIFDIRNSIAHGKKSTAVEAESLDIYRQGTEYFRRSCIFYIKHLAEGRT